MKNDIHYELKGYGIPSDVLVNLDRDVYDESSDRGYERMYRYGFRSLHDRFEAEDWSEAA